MSHTSRIIARMDVKGRGLVKGIHLEGLRVIGVPERIAPWYEQQGADELLFIDVVASLYDRNNLVEIVEATAQSLSVPLIVAGGIRSVEDCEALLRAGADKIAINTAAVATPDLLDVLVEKFGSSTIVLSVEAKSRNGWWEVQTKSGRESTGRNVVDWVREANERGVGEVLMTSIDKDGSGGGLDTELLEAVRGVCPVPLIASGGVGGARHAAKALKNGMADAVAAASVFHYHPEALDMARDLAADVGNQQFLTSARTHSKISPMLIGEMKMSLASEGIAVRV